MTDASHLLMIFAAIMECAALSYLLGSIPFGLILGKLCGAGDIRKIGSGNIGATNMLRTGKRGVALATLICDMAKGAAAVLIVPLLANWFIEPLLKDSHLSIDTHHMRYFFGLCAVVGHVWPVWLHFKGGKGVATALGVYLAGAPYIGVLSIACWLAVFWATRYSSLAAIIALSLAPLLGYVFAGTSFVVLSLVIAVIVISRHKDNIRRLLKGEEHKWSNKHES